MTPLPTKSSHVLSWFRATSASHRAALVALLAASCGASQVPCDIQPPPACCARPFFKAPAAGAKIAPYRTLERTRVSCPYLNPKRCERKLRERACELGADVLIVHTWTLVGRRGPAQINEEALLVRFDTRPVTR